jgi:hypothetical protein
MKPALLLPAAAALLASACFPAALNVRTQRDRWSPAMSSTVGLDLTPVYVPPLGSSVRYHWRANFGTFLAWAAPDYKAVDLGPEVVSDGGALYWSYDPRLSGAVKPPVVVSIEAWDGNGHVLARKTIRLGWERDTAVLRD